MAEKTYQLNIEKSDGTTEKVSFTIPASIGTYNIKFILSDGRVIVAGNINVDDTEHTYNLKLTLSDGSTINAGTIVTPAVSPPVFASASWAEIAGISEAGKASAYFAVGDEKTIELSTGEQITLVILGFDHDDLSDGSGKAGMTIGMKNLLATKYSMDVTDTSDGWYKSEMRKSTMTRLLSSLPSDLQAAIKTVKKKATEGSNGETITTYPDKLWLFSRVEIDGINTQPWVNEGTQYEYWETIKNGTVKNDRIKYLSNGQGSASHWWLRTLMKGGLFQIITIVGSFTSSHSNEFDGVCFGFCV